MLSRSIMVLLGSFSAVVAAVPVLEPQACNVLLDPSSSPYVPSNGSVEAYLANTMWAEWSSMANTPIGYTRAFYNLPGSVQNVESYITYSTLPTYDPDLCATQCSNNAECGSFNLYFARSPKYQIVPGRCENPEPITQVHCALYRTALDETQATNGRQSATGNSHSFETLHLGSNGYNLAPTLSHKTTTGADLQFSLHESLDDLALELSPVDSALTLPPGTTTETSVQQCAELCSADSSCKFFNTFREVVSGLPVDQEVHKCAVFPGAMRAHLASLWGYDVFHGEGVVSHQVRVKDSKTWVCGTC